MHKVILSMMFLLLGMASFISGAHATGGDYPIPVTTTATTVSDTWTKLNGSASKWTEAEIYERSGTYKLLLFADTSGVTYNAAAYYTTIKADERYYLLGYDSNVVTKGTYVSTTASGISATVEFRTIRKAKDD